MPFAFHPFHRLAVRCSMTYNAVPYQSQGRIWNLYCTGGDSPMICPSDQEKLSRSQSPFRLSNIWRFL